MTAQHWTHALHDLDACDDALAWAEGYDSLDAAWAACERGDWMLWLAGRVAGPPGDDTRRPLVLAACACARLALPYVPDGEERPLRAIEIAEAWARGDAGVTLEQVRYAAEAAAAYAAEAAAAYAAYAAAAYAAEAAADAAAAYAAEAAADAAADAATDDAAAAAYAAAAVVAVVGDRVATLRQCADLVREYYPTPPVLPEAGDGEA
jgi:hypothetical protein